MLNSVVMKKFSPEIQTHAMLVTSKHFNHQTICCFCDIIWLPLYDIQY